MLKPPISHEQLLELQAIYDERAFKVVLDLPIRLISDLKVGQLLVRRQPAMRSIKRQLAFTPMKFWIVLSIDECSKVVFFDDQYTNDGFPIPEEELALANIYQIHNIEEVKEHIVKRGRKAGKK